MPQTRALGCAGVGVAEPILAVDATRSAAFAPTDVRDLRVALVSAEDPTDAAYSSGTPASLIAALADLVDHVIPISASPSPAAKRIALRAGRLGGVRHLRSWRAEMAASDTSARLRLPMLLARSVEARRQLARIGSVDLCIQHGSEYSLGGGRGRRYVTYEDSTVHQAVGAYPWPHLAGVTDFDLRVLTLWQKAVYRRATACCTMSAWAASSVIDDYAISADRVIVAGVGPNHEFTGPPARDWWPPRFLFIGADWQRKNGDFLLRAFAALQAVIPEARLDIVGAHPEIHAPGVRSHGFLALSDGGDRATLSRLFDQATVLVAPSLHDPSPVVHVEAGAAGIGSIGSKNGGAATVIGPGGLLVDPTSVEDLTEAMAAMTNPELARHFGAEAREHAARLTWRSVAERLIRAARVVDADAAALAQPLPLHPN